MSDAVVVALVAAAAVLLVVVGAVAGRMMARWDQPRPSCGHTAAECKDAWLVGYGPCCRRCSGHRDER